MPAPRLTLVLPLVALALVAAGAWWFQKAPSSASSTAPAQTAGAPPGGTGAGAAAAPGPGGPSGPRPAGGPGGAGGGGGQGPVAVEVARAVNRTLVDEAQGVGSLRSRQGVMLRPEVSGRVARLGFADGQAVQRGQVLVQLDDTLQRAQLQQAEAQASIARTNLQRSRELFAQQFVSASAVDQNAAALQVAEAQVALAQAQVARMRVLAPFDGRAGIGNVNLGDYVKDGADLVNLEDSRAMLVDLRLPERFAGRLKPGLIVHLDVDAMAGKRFEGRVEALDSQIDTNGRSLLVRARVDNPGLVLKAGMFARANVIFAVRENAVVVPEEALVPQGGKQWLVKVVDGPDGKPVSRRIEARLGLRLPGVAEVLEGVAAGDRVVTAGHARLMRDQPVPLRVVELGRGAPPGGPKGSQPGGPPAGPPSGSGPGPAADRPSGPAASGAAPRP